MVPAGLIDALRSHLLALGVEPPAEIVVEVPRVREHGDLSTNVALAVAKRAGRPPRALADELAARLRAEPPPHVREVEVAGAGFVNLRLSHSWLESVLTDVVTQGVDGYARPDVGHATRVDVEYVSANPTGPLHAGHARWAAYGDSLCRVLERCGYDVHREFYVNDRGVQTQVYAASLVARRDGTDLPEGGYAGDYIVEWAAEMPADADPLEWGLAKAHEYQRDTLARMGVHFDTWFSERSLAASGAMDDTLAELGRRGHTYESEGATWLRTEPFGDDKDRVLVKTDGEPTYLLPDIAYHRDKLARGFELMVDILGADHHGYVARMAAAVQALGHPREAFEAIIGQQVVLMRGGQEVKLSKRRGDIIEMAEILDEVGPDAARLTFLLQSVDTKQVFDLDLAVAQSSENPVYYVQYAHARIAAIGRRAAELGVVRAPLGHADLSQLGHEREDELLRILATLPDVVAEAAERRAPSKVATWVRELAGAYHGFQHDCPVLRSDVDPALTQARLWLVEATRIGLLIGLGLLGVSAPESM